MSDRDWTCDACGVLHDRDLNAAKTLLWLGKLTASLEEIPAVAAKWTDWIQPARHDVEIWRAKKAFSMNSFKVQRDFDSVAVANSEDGRYETDLMLKETADLAEGNFHKETVGELRTLPPKRQRTHLSLTKWISIN